MLPACHTGARYRGAVSPTAVEWTEITRRNARSVQTLVGWIFWDPGALIRYEELGLNGPLGYIAARCAPFAGAGPDAVAAAFGSISPLGIGIVFGVLNDARAFLPFAAARDAAVLDGLAEFAPAARDGLAQWANELWKVVEQLPSVARPLFAAHRAMPRADNPTLRGWHAVNCLREWRGDTHWAIVASQALSGDEASVLHNGWLHYEGDWLSQSRGNTPESIDAAWASLCERGLASERSLTPAGLSLRQRIEDETDRATAQPWRLLGELRSREFAVQFEPPCVDLLARVDLTAGINYQPASRVRAPWTP